jgi:hypothetical protein
MTHLRGVLAVGFIVLASAGPAAGQVQVDSVKPEAAWCGGSYSVSDGTSFGDCVAIARSVRGLQGDTMISVPTFPAIPASQVVFDGERTYHVTVDRDGRETRVELPPVSKPETK